MKEVSALIILVLLIPFTLAITPPDPPEAPESPNQGEEEQEENTQEQESTAQTNNNQELATLQQQIQALERQIREIEQQPTQTEQPTQNYLPLIILATVLLLNLTLTIYLLIKQRKPDKQLSSYVQNCRQQGYTDEQITTVLKRSGYNKKIIKKAFRKT